jgi:hypothetical protein
MNKVEVATFEDQGFGWKHTWILYGDHIRLTKISLWFIKRRRNIPLVTLRPSYVIYILQSRWTIALLILFLAYLIGSFMAPDWHDWLISREDFLHLCGIYAILCLISAFWRDCQAAIAGEPPVYIKFRRRRLHDVDSFVSAIISQIGYNREL